ncbi:hypothetical protein SGGMMB4_01293 [Sodalis glossinidius str. 'morsitans']|uniref:Uncharacterized protein n=2 Tax=Sodalis glossinidius TaxID=63612 RepID=Q2NVJ7_SODGM|nr:hypothetical protein [Sodalis glossinidius]AAS66830.1 orfA [Sodalis glossinidius]BAE73828.1 hypothetical protein SG0553 [Sodalis glossinidius str. 'morsitans']CRL44275.1 hypothetical protein SGGMMB4_01293 [Sodalis glossinidius str. 'morsitans']
MNISAMSAAVSSARSSSTATSGDFNQIVTDWLSKEQPKCTLTELKQQIKALYPNSSHVVTQKEITSALLYASATLKQSLSLEIQNYLKDTLNPLTSQSLGLSYTYDNFMQAMIMGNDDDAPEPFF